MKAVLVITYLFGGHIVDTNRFDAANIEECNRTKKLALSANTPITTRYSSRVAISAECKEVASRSGEKL
jgi:hypothetical protein